MRDLQVHSMLQPVAASGKMPGNFAQVAVTVEGSQSTSARIGPAAFRVRDVRQADRGWREDDSLR